MNEPGRMQSLLGHAKRLSSVSLRELMAAPRRFETYSRQACDILLDFSRQRLDEAALADLLTLAEQSDLETWKNRLFTGDTVNNSESRAALHMALRARDDDDYSAGGQDVMAGVLDERRRMLAFADGIRSGDITGRSSKPLRRIVNIGIGGSDLGVRMAATALANYAHADLDLHCVSNIDGVQLEDALRDADPDATLFIICSKTMTTTETRANAELARTWLVDHLGADAVPGHFAAVSCNEEAMDEFGIAPDRRFLIWDWVGGRYSIWSSMGVALAIVIGGDQFLQFLAGGRNLDVHFRETPAADNLPVLQALISIWNSNYLGAGSHVVLPYDQRLSEFPRYLQQLIMESLGKRVTRDGDDVQWDTGVATWGEPGSNAQHAFMQMLHQGTMKANVDFILPAVGSSRFLAQHDATVANCIGQAQALAMGCDDDDPHRAQPGSRPSTLILIPRLDPGNLGRLVAMYEHSVFVQSIIWGINPFDQFGVQLGKQLAREFSTDSQNGGSRPVGPARWLADHKTSR